MKIENALTLTLPIRWERGQQQGVFSFARLFNSFQRLFPRKAGSVSPSPIGWERAGVRVF
jgi:hypothetical protein